MIRSCLCAALVCQLLLSNSLEAESVRQAVRSVLASHHVLPSGNQDEFLFIRKGPGDGAAPRPIQAAFFRCPADYAQPITISVYDPDGSGHFDSRETVSSRFAVYGGSGAYTDSGARMVFPDPEQAGTLLAAETFQDQNDAAWFDFGPFLANQGEVVGEWAYFKIVCQAIEGKGENRFRLRASPRDAIEAFSFNVSLFLSNQPSTVAELFVGAAAGQRRVIGVSSPFDPALGIAYLRTAERKIKLTQPADGGWVRYDLDLKEKEAGSRLTYKFVKSSEAPAHVILAFTVEDGAPLPLYGAYTPVQWAVNQTQSLGEDSTQADRPASPAVIKESAAPEKPQKVAAQTAAPETPGDPDLTMEFDASKSFDPDNDNLAYEWDFGDGSPVVRTIRVAHTYREPGRYVVTLKVDDGMGRANSTVRASQKIVVNIPPEVKADVPPYAETNKVIVLDASGSKDSPGETLKFYWELGDGTSLQGKKIHYAYKRSGKYQIQLNVRDDMNADNSQSVLEKQIQVNGRPIAKAIYTVQDARTNSRQFAVILDGSGSLDPDGDTLTYTWKFDDGSTATGAKVEKRYSKPGTDHAILSVKDNSGTPFDTGTAEVRFEMNHAPFPVASVPSSGWMGQTVVFDASKSHDEDGDALTYTWKIGESVVEKGPALKHRFNRPGKYPVLLTIDDGRGLSNSRKQITQVVEIRSAPVRLAIKGPEGGLIDVAQEFRCKAENAQGDLVYTWNFGDGSEVNGPEVKHIFRRSGLYTVKVSVSDPSDPAAVLAAKDAVLRIHEQPVAKIAWIEEPCCPGKVVQFDASKSKDPDGNRLSYLWDFGDGNTSKAETPKYAYRKGGVYKITLTVDDSSGLPGSRNTVSTVARINRSPVAVISFH